VEAFVDSRRRAVHRLARARAVTRDPLGAAVRWRASRDAGALLQRHARLARRAGVDRVYLVLSFDCDTADDASVAWDVHARLGEFGVCPTYAVPGALLLRAAEVYGRIAADGAEFLNHGGVEHTYFNEALGRHASCFFYDELKPGRVRRDIEEGDAIVADVLGRRARGYRTPHFGTYQRVEQLRHLHSVLRELGYRFSTSTGPRFGLRHGPISARLGLPELAVTGIPESPFEILDTWGFFAAPDRRRTPADYVRQARVLADALSAAGAGVINVYGDPIHVYDRPEFFDAVEAWRAVAEPVSFAELLARVGW
jgi:peptidoglycan/xylan/chitin deacetylase (PgdA/CDA1 family)